MAAVSGMALPQRSQVVINFFPICDKFQLLIRRGFALNGFTVAVMHGYHSISSAFLQMLSKVEIPSMNSAADLQ